MEETAIQRLHSQLILTIRSSFTHLEQKINERPVYVMFEESLGCDPMIDHLTPRNLLPIYKPFLDVIQIELGSQVFPVIAQWMANEFGPITSEGVQINFNLMQKNRVLSEELADTKKSLTKVMKMNEENTRKMKLLLQIEGETEITGKNVGEVFKSDHKEVKVEVDVEKIEEHNSVLQRQLYKQADVIASLQSQIFSYEDEKQTVVVPVVTQLDKAVQCDELIVEESDDDNTTEELTMQLKNLSQTNMELQKFQSAFEPTLKNLRQKLAEAEKKSTKCILEKKQLAFLLDNTRTLNQQNELAIQNLNQRITTIYEAADSMSGLETLYLELNPQKPKKKLEINKSEAKITLDTKSEPEAKNYIYNEKGQTINLDSNTRYFKLTGETLKYADRATQEEIKCNLNGIFVRVHEDGSSSWFDKTGQLFKQLITGQIVQVDQFNRLCINGRYYTHKGDEYFFDAFDNIFVIVKGKKVPLESNYQQMAEYQQPEVMEYIASQCAQQADLPLYPNTIDKTSTIYTKSGPFSLHGMYCTRSLTCTLVNNVIQFTDKHQNTWYVDLVLKHYYTLQNNVKIIPASITEVQQLISPQKSIQIQTNTLELNLTQTFSTSLEPIINQIEKQYSIKGHSEKSAQTEELKPNTNGRMNLRDCKSQVIAYKPYYTKKDF
ncbi:Coiled-coil_protein [Hexamita inflata]|uniref:Coiled-coil_protein n=1 Tax=Hexamita inflata TaxID=28002 RepID=A0ABP1HRD2_9EUKA